MAATLLQIVQRAFRRRGLPQPTFVNGNTDASVRMAQGLLEELCDDLVTRKFWEKVAKQASFTSVAQEDQGAIETLTDSGFIAIRTDTFWDRTQILPVQGGESAESWQAMHAVNLQGPLPKFRLMGGRLLLFPAPAAGHTFSFEYSSSLFIQSDDGAGNTVYLRYFDKDTDTCLVDESLPTAWLRWAWNREKGLDYAEEFARYENLINTFGAVESAPKPVNLASEIRPMRPGIIVPEGNWNIP